MSVYNCIVGRHTLNGRGSSLWQLGGADERSAVACCLPLVEYPKRPKALWSGRHNKLTHIFLWLIYKHQYAVKCIHYDAELDLDAFIYSWNLFIPQMESSTIQTCISDTDEITFQFICSLALQSNTKSDGWNLCRHILTFNSLEGVNATQTEAYYISHHATV